jgi:MFS family permease
MSRKPYTPRRVIFTYISTNGLFTLAASLIWAINTIFLMQRGGLTIFQVMLLNTIYLIAQMIFEVPTGVVADTIGRKASFLLSIGTIIVSTLLYVATPVYGWGFLGFAIASVFIGVGFTFQTGAVDAWMVDALDASGWEGHKERVFSWGFMAFGAAGFVGALLGGFLGSANLLLPYVLRAAVLVAAFVLVMVLMHDEGFEPRPLRIATFGAETRKIFDAGVHFGWRSRVVRPLMFVSLVTGVTGMYAFYSWQPYLLQLLGRNAVWLLGVVQAGAFLATMAGNALVPVVMRAGERRRDATQVLAVGALGVAGFTAAIGLLGYFVRVPGVVPAAIAIGLWVGWSVLFGLLGPVRSGFINEHIPSAQRATVLSLDSLFGDAGGAGGNVALGWVSGRFGYSPAWIVGAVFFGLASPLYVVAGKAVQAENAEDAGGQ